MRFKALSWLSSVNIWTYRVVGQLLSERLPAEGRCRVYITQHYWILIERKSIVKSIHFHNYHRDIIISKVFKLLYSNKLTFYAQQIRNKNSYNYAKIL